MSTYYRIKGRLVFSPLGFDAVMALLKKGEWLNDGGYWLDEDGGRVYDKPHARSPVIEFPDNFYLNLLSDPLLVGKLECARGRLIAASDTTCMSMGAVSFKAPVEAFASRPCPYDTEAAAAWQEECVNKFFDLHAWGFVNI
jgi:hypothetical protein